MTKTLLLVMNPRRIPAAIAAIDALSIDKVWLRCFWEKELETVIAEVTKLAKRLEYTHLILLSDDTVPTQEALDAVLECLTAHPVATGYCNLDATLPFVNLTKTPFTRTNESYADDYNWYRREEIEAWPSDLVPTCFGGACLTAMSVEMWERFPFEVLSRPDAAVGYASDWKLSVRLQQAAIPIVAPKRAFVRHLKTVWLEGPAQEKDPDYRLLMGTVTPAIIWDLKAASSARVMRELNARPLPKIPPIQAAIQAAIDFDPIAYWQEAGKNAQSPDHEKNFVDGPAFRHQEERLLEAISHLEFTSILEIGCGFGRITKLLRERYPDAEITAIDLSPERLVSTRAKVGNSIELVASTVQSFDPPPVDERTTRTWDLVLAVETLMHIPPNEIESVVRKLASLSDRYVVHLDWDKSLGSAPISPHNWLHDYRKLHDGQLTISESIGLQGLYCRHINSGAGIAATKTRDALRAIRSFKVCLTMIVRDEAHVIARCLASAKPFIDRWCIVDTGSTDQTADIVRDALHDIPGALHQRPWNGFGPARTDAFDLALQSLESESNDERWYALVLDADELISGELPSYLDAPACSVQLHMSKVQYKQLRMFELRRKWRYEGVLHEFPTCDGNWSDQRLDEIMIASASDGARSRTPDKYKKDAEVLESAIRELNELADPAREPLKTRYVFYLAQSYRDAQDDRKAAENYLRRAEMGGGLNWEEIYISLLEAGRALERIGSFADADHAFLRAHHIWAERPEAVKELRRIFDARAKNTKAVGILFLETD